MYRLKTVVGGGKSHPWDIIVDSELTDAISVVRMVSQKLIVMISRETVAFDFPRDCWLVDCCRFSKLVSVPEARCV